MHLFERLTVKVLADIAHKKREEMLSTKYVQMCCSFFFLLLRFRSVAEFCDSSDWLEQKHRCVSCCTLGDFWCFHMCRLPSLNCKFALLAIFFFHFEKWACGVFCAGRLCCRQFYISGMMRRSPADERL